MRAIHRKLLRDLRRAWSQVISIAVLVACGAMGALGMRGALAAVSRARDAFYDAQQFAHVFVSLKRAPESLAMRVREIPGVAQVQTRVTATAALDVPGLPDPAVGQLVSVDARAEGLNAPLVRRGRAIAPGRGDETLVSARFAQENRLRPGDSLAAVIEGRWRRLRIVGIAVSPEYVFEVGGGGFLVDNRRFGVIWMDRALLAPATGMEGAFDDLTLRLAPDASEADVIARLDRLLAPYGGRGAHGRSRQISEDVLSDEIEQLRVMALIFPLFFVGTAAFLLNIVLARLVASQREELAALKAFGYSDGAVAFHYLGFAGVAVVIGGALGVLGGWWMGARFTALYVDVFMMPGIVHRLDWPSAVVSVAVSGGAALLGALAAVRGAARLPPAEALRPPSPARFRPLIAERLGVARHIPASTRMLLRNLERRPMRTLLGTLGVAMGGAVLVTGFAPYDSVNAVIDLQLRRARRDDLSVVLARPAHASTVRASLARVPGVRYAEPYRIVPVRLHHAHRVRSLAITGLGTPSQLQRLVALDGRARRVAVEGLVLGRSLARILELRVGDTVGIELVEWRDVRRQAIVAAVLDEPMGVTAYMAREALGRLARDGDLASGAHLSLAAGAEQGAYAALKRIPAVAGVSSRAALLAQFELQMARSMAVTRSIVIFAATALTLGVVYNGARIALSERGRELASLRVLGFTRREVAALLLGEQAITTIAAIPFGMLFGLGLSALLLRAIAQERHEFPLVVQAHALLWSAMVIVAAAALAGLAMRRRVYRLDLIGVLKTRE